MRSRSGDGGGSPFAAGLATPVYPDVTLYVADGGALVPRAWEFGGWERESLSWKEGCSLHAGLSGRMRHTIEGPDAVAFLERICINGFATFPVGSSKHAIMLDDDGLIATHGLLQREADDRFTLFGFPRWVQYQASRLGLDVAVTTHATYLFQIGGPTSLPTLERVTGESLRDLGFLRFRQARLQGRAGAATGLATEVSRIGMSGTLAYELRGPIDEGPAVYDAVFQAGADFGIERLGWRTYTVNHIEAGFPQNNWTFIVAGEDDADYQRFLGRPSASLRSGSVDPADLRARQRTPVEVDWHAVARFDHDFIGRAALEAEVAAPRRTIVTLVWNAEDVLDIYGSLLRPGEPFTQIELPTSPHQRGAHAHADHVRRDGEIVGVSSGTTYSLHFREVISHATIDLDAARIGQEVVVQWGDFGGPIKDVRATVARYPYLDAPRNRDVDLAAIPSGIA